MTQKISYGPLVRFCLHPLIFTMDSAYKGVVAGIGILILYPLLSIIVDSLKKRIHTTDAFYIISFLGVFSGTLYILSVGMVDWELYKDLAFVFPASMTASVMLIGWLEDHENNKESTPFIEAFISALLVILFSCMKDFLLHGTLDFRLGEFGVIYNFGGSPFFTKFEYLVTDEKYFWLSAIKLKGLMFFIIGILICLMGVSTSEKDHK